MEPSADGEYVTPYQAYVALVDREAAALWDAQLVERSGGIGLVLYKLKRLLIRSMRVLFGACLAVGAWVAGASALETFERRIASLSIAELGRAVALACLAYILAKFAFSSAFGARPTLAEEKESVREQAAAAINRRNAGSNGRTA